MNIACDQARQALKQIRRFLVEVVLEEQHGSRFQGCQPGKGVCLKLGFGMIKIHQTKIISDEHFDTNILALLEHF